MVDRLSALVGAGVITAGVSAAMLAGAGVAVADPDAATGGGDTTSKVESTDPPAADGTDTPDTTDDSTDTTEDTDEADEQNNEPDDGAEDTGDGGDDSTATDSSTTDNSATDNSATDNSAIDDSDADAPAPAAPGGQSAVDESDEAPTDDLPVDEAQADEKAPAAENPVDTADPSNLDTAELTPAALIAPSSTSKPLATLRALDTVSEAATAPARQTLLSLIGTVIFNIYSVAIRVLGGPPILPAGSTVTVRSSSLTIDCGDGYDVPADWYVPEGPTPTRLIYFQHGFMAAGPFYSYTAARLAEATHSIVVATSLTSNFLACDGCWVGGSPMHKAVADLFADGNTALAQSALAAGYSSTLLDGIEKIGLTGHSAGGGLAAGAAGFMTQNGSFDKLAGVVMLDGVGFGDVTPEALAKLPADFPIYNLAARAYYWNLSGTTNTALEEWRPGVFNGVKLADSSHGDAMLGGNVFVQIAMNLVTGWPRPENVKAAEVISAAWFNDMFTETAPSPESGFYGAPGAVLKIETSRGTATAQVLPGDTERVTFLDWLFTFGAKILFGIDFATCAAEPVQRTAGSAETPELFSAPDTLLSLDGRTKAGQSIGQQCVVA